MRRTCYFKKATILQSGKFILQSAVNKTREYLCFDLPMTTVFTVVHSLDFDQIKIPKYLFDCIFTFLIIYHF